MDTFAVSLDLSGSELKNKMDYIVISYSNALTSSLLDYTCNILVKVSLYIYTYINNIMTTFRLLVSMNLFCAKD